MFILAFNLLTKNIHQRVVFHLLFSQCYIDRIRNGILDHLFFKKLLFLMFSIRRCRTHGCLRQGMLIMVLLLQLLLLLFHQFFRSGKGTHSRPPLVGLFILFKQQLSAFIQRPFQALNGPFLPRHLFLECLLRCLHDMRHIDQLFLGLFFQHCVFHGNGFVDLFYFFSFGDFLFDGCFKLHVVSFVNLDDTGLCSGSNMIFGNHDGGCFFCCFLLIFRGCLCIFSSLLCIPSSSSSSSTSISSRPC
mmetsp:Transcript_3568/g.5444  ORF Transcript_3568/g.5444 Transcript_3568/m.5444 type:complete len:246 (+) Transcript_3568:710-1447(+)